MAVLLSACAQPSRTAESFPTLTRIMTALPTTIIRSASTISPTETPILPASPTSVPPALILADFPLSLGASWKYSAEITYQGPNDYTKDVTWSGFITDEVIDQKTTPGEKIVFTLKEDLEPTPPQDVWRQSRTYEYTVSGNGIFEGKMKIYQWPLSDRLIWKSIPDFGYDMNADYVGDVETPYGTLKGCYEFRIVTNPDTSIDTFCPRVGFVNHSYMHHGTPQIEHFVLVAYKSGQ